MKAKTLHAGLPLLTLHCAVWIAFTPLIPQLHQTFANHGHVFCLQHHRIENAGLRQSAYAVDDSSVDASVRAASTKDDSTGLDLRLACTFSNLVVQFAQSSPPPRLASVPTEERELKLLAHLVIPALIVYLLAPKHSPPSAA